MGTPRLYTFLSNGSSARGAQMGRPNYLPTDRDLPIKFRIERLKFVDGDYDCKGAYWGSGIPIWYARSTEALPDDTYHAEFFMRARSRQEVKSTLLDLVPGAKFFR